MAERQKRVNELDPNPGQGDVEFKKAVLGAAAILGDLGKTRFMEVDGDCAEFTIADDDRSARLNADINPFRGMYVDTELKIPQGRYVANYVDTQEGHHEPTRSLKIRDFADGSSREVPNEHLPKHERKMRTRDDHDASTRERYREATGPKVYVKGTDVPMHIPEEHRQGYIDAVKDESYRHHTDVKNLRRHYNPTLYEHTKHGKRAAKIINHQVAKRLKKHAADLREKKIADLKSIDLGDDDI